MTDMFVHHSQHGKCLICEFYLLFWSFYCEFLFIYWISSIRSAHKQPMLIIVSLSKCKIDWNTCVHLCYFTIVGSFLLLIVAEETANLLLLLLLWLFSIPIHTVRGVHQGVAQICLPIWNNEFSYVHPLIHSTDNTFKKKPHMYNICACIVCILIKFNFYFLLFSRSDVCLRGGAMCIL